MWKGARKWNRCVGEESISERHSLCACPHLMIWKGSQSILPLTEITGFVNFPEHDNLFSYFLEKPKMTYVWKQAEKESGERIRQLDTEEKWLSWDNGPRECQCQTLDHDMILPTLLPLLIFILEREVYKRVGQLHLEAGRSTWWELISKLTRSSNSVLPTHCHQCVMQGIAVVYLVRLDL